MQKYSYLLHCICDAQRFKICKTIICANTLYLMLNKVNGCIEEINGNKCLSLVPTKESKEKIKSMKKCGMKSEIQLDQ